jgi:hypothetical protein
MVKFAHSFSGMSVNYDEMSKNGVSFERYDNMPGGQDDRAIARGKAANMGPDIAWFKDPAGNILAVLEN